MGRIVTRPIMVATACPSQYLPTHFTNSIEVSPQLCGGDSQRLTYAGRCDFPVVPPKAQRKGSHDERLSTITAHTMGMQISPCLYSEVSEEGVVSGAAERPGARVSGPGAPQGVSGGGGAFTIGSCAYAGEYPA